MRQLLGGGESFTSIYDASITRYDFNTSSKKFDLKQVIEKSGEDACYVAINSDASLADISVYGTAQVILFDIDSDRKKMSHKYTFKNTGNSINQTRQKTAHMHLSSWDIEDKFLYAVDLRTDEILVFDVDNQNAQAIHRIKMTPGDGPHHLSFHPTLPLVYSINELSNTITIFKQNKQYGSLAELQRIKLLQGELDEKQFSSAIKISSDGNFLYAAVRGVNMINAYAIGATGQLKLIDSESVAGNWPRGFSISPSGKFILVANQRSNTSSTQAAGY